ncbi:glutathione S-transferase N-terminal domain-containing protein [Candidatus Woesearchaeota archaeon]|nr:glutathione S-transferase N-terminal domain-containing protein [Candidatus Woesearchaeota archaeon]
MEKTKSDSKKSPKIKIYTTSTCPWCVKTKEFLKANNVKYEDVNVGMNEKARNEMFEKSGQFGVPVTDINGTIIVGYDKEALKKALSL